jgi:hypothetical protein
MLTGRAISDTAGSSAVSRRRYSAGHFRGAPFADITMGRVIQLNLSKFRKVKGRDRAVRGQQRGGHPMLLARNCGSVAQETEATGKCGASSHKLRGGSGHQLAEIVRAIDVRQ